MLGQLFLRLEHVSGRAWTEKWGAWTELGQCLDSAWTVLGQIICALNNVPDDDDDDDDDEVDVDDDDDCG